MDTTDAGSVREWLRGLGLERHAARFEAEDIAFDVLPELDAADLEALGIASLGERKRLLKAIASLGGAAAAAASAGPRPEAERRQLTVMFCDMVGSTALAARLDPEDLQQAVRSYHAAVARAVAPYEGHVAQLLGDGVLVYFGYPRAHEDDALRAVRAALAVLDAVRRLRLPAAPGVDATETASRTVATRIGIATGRVVVGEVGSGTPAAEQTASGETPNLAARLQAEAAPGEIVVAEETRQLLGATFELEPLGPRRLKGFAAPVEAWRVLAERSLASRFEAQHESELIGFVGRDSEVALLEERWALAREGEGQAVLLSGEAGIGKSRIVHTFRERLAREPVATVLLQCSPYGSGSALQPLVRYFERVSGIAPEDDAAARTAKLQRLLGAGEMVPDATFGQLLRIMGLPDGGRLPPAAPGAGNAAQLQAPIELLRRLARDRPVLLLIEDAHWIDPTTDELGALAIEQLRDARVLILITARPEYTPRWGHPAHLTRLALNRLGRAQSAALVARVAGGRSLPPEVLAEILKKTDGIPLFVEELTKTVLQSGLLEASPDGRAWVLPVGSALPALAIPTTLQDSLMARLDRLAPAKEVAQVAALIGREFSRSLLAEVLRGTMPESRLEAALDELVGAELVVRRGDSYAFRHALIRDTASGSLLKSQAVLRHAQIAAALQATEPEQVALQPELLAHHQEQGGLLEAALASWRAAAAAAMQRLALREAVAHHRAALALLPRLAEAGSAAAGPAAELELQTQLGSLLLQTEGYGAVVTSATFERARELALALGRLDAFAVSCAGYAVTQWAAGRFSTARELLAHVGPAEQARLAPMSRVFGALVLGLVELHLGRLAEAERQTSASREALAETPPHERVDVGGIDADIVVLSQLVSIFVHQGRLDEADAASDEALAIAERREHPPSRAWALSLARWKAFRRGDAAESVRLAHEINALSERMGFTSRAASGQMMLGRALVAAGRVDEGLALLRAGHALWQAGSVRATGTEYASHAAEVLIEAGRLAEALEFVVAGEAAQAAIEERFYAAELLRQRGRLAEAGLGLDDGEDGAARAEWLYREAMQVAEAQGARLFALRAATDLARRLAASGRADEGRALLAPLRAAFTQGAAYPEVRRADALLAA